MQVFNIMIYLQLYAFVEVFNFFRDEAEYDHMPSCMQNMLMLLEMFKPGQLCSICSALV